MHSMYKNRWQYESLYDDNLIVRAAGAGAWGHVLDQVNYHAR